MEKFSFPALIDDVLTATAQAQKVLYLSAAHPSIAPTAVRPHFVHRVIVDAGGQLQEMALFPDADFDVVVVDSVIQLVGTSRTFISDCLEKCRVGGKLVMIVPDQFFDDRAWQCPSHLNWGSHVKRLYTPATLLMELEESLPPASYRLDCLKHGNLGDDAVTSWALTGLFVSMTRLSLDKYEALLRASVASQAVSPNQYLPKRDSSDILYPFEAVEYFVTTSSVAVASVCVLKLDHRGDFLLALEAFSALRLSLPHARIVLVCGSWNRDVAVDSGLFDEIICFDVYPEDISSASTGFDDVSYEEDFVRALAARSFDVAIDLRTFPDSRKWLERISARVKAGFDRWREFDWLTVSLPFVNQEAMWPPVRIAIADSAMKVETAPSKRRIVERSFNLDRGVYYLEVLAISEAPVAEIQCVIIAEDDCRVAHVSKTLDRSGFGPTIEFRVSKQSEQLKFVLSTSPECEVFGLNIVRRGQDGYLNQAEAMVLLVQLTLMRLRLRLGSRHTIRAG